MVLYNNIAALVKKVGIVVVVILYWYINLYIKSRRLAYTCKFGRISAGSPYPLAISLKFLIWLPTLTSTNNVSSAKQLAHFNMVESPTLLLFGWLASSDCIYSGSSLSSKILYRISALNSESVAMGGCA